MRYDFSVPPVVSLPLAAFVATLILHFAALKMFPVLGLLDFPKRYGLDRAPIPYPTGVFPVAVFVIFFVMLEPLNLENIAIISGIVLLATACMTDDRTPLHPAPRIIIQTLIAGLIVLGGVRIDAVTNPLPGVLGAAGSITLDSGLALALSIAFTILWLLFTINAINWFDGIPGQVSTISTIAFVTIGFLAISERVNQPTLALLAFILAGISLAALLFDFPPPKVLMGDTGAMFFGLMVGILTVYSGGKVATAFLVLGVPLIDLLFVVIRRLRRGQFPWQGNATDQHLHHRLLGKGWSPRKIIALTAGIGAAFGVTALFLDTWEKACAGLLLFLVMLGLSIYSNAAQDKK